jgi:hypothetical protein
MLGQRDPANGISIKHDPAKDIKMKIADVLRQVADAIEQQQDAGQPDPSIQNPAQLAAVPTGPYGDGVEAPDNQDAGADDDVMIPPLQLKMELLKRAVGVDNVYDAGEPRADEAHSGDGDEIQHIRRMAGIPVAAVMELDNDELLDD